MMIRNFSNVISVKRKGSILQITYYTNIKYYIDILHHCDMVYKKGILSFTHKIIFIQ